jgi:hypothetical protein
MDAALAANLIAAQRDQIAQDLKALSESISTFPPTSDYGALATLGILEVLKTPEDFLSKTGLVFAGFGDLDIFPSMIEHRSCGIIDGRHISKEVARVKIDHALPAWLSGFAQTAMIDTFQLGLSEDVYNIVRGALSAHLGPLVAQILTKVGANPAYGQQLDNLIGESRRAILQQMMDQAKENHSFPLRRVLGVLPVDEMAELAETLINLQSLKEKVTKPSETVGGPVDVAVITKSEGLVWIKRKLYFDPALNSRYMQRQAMAVAPDVGGVG